MKRLAAFILCAVLVQSVLPAFASEEVLRVYNWQDYINEGKDDDGAKVDDSVLELWEQDYYKRTGKRVRVQYDTFETNETMLNTLKTGKTSYDLACPSDYIIQKMIAATESGTDDSISIERFDVSKMDNYRKYVSPFISDMFEQHGWTEYAVGYMWGTVGILYNPEKIPYEDASSLELFWNTVYKNRITCKDVSREAYVIGALYVYIDELRKHVKQYNDGKISAGELQKFAHGVINNVKPETVKKVGNALVEMKENIYGFEVDSGKTDMVAGKIDANLAWSGDAVYSMDLAEEEDNKKLEFVVPREGSAIWFDGWIMPKGANTELAQDFVDFLCKPEIAAMNMDYIGYTSAIAGKDIFNLVKDNYGEKKGKYEYDLTYFFDGTLPENYYNKNGKITLRTNDLHRQLMAQYPSMEEAARCGIMEDFGERNEAVLEMWSMVKSNNISALSYFVMFAILLLIILTVILKTVRRQRFNTRRKRYMKENYGESE